MEGNITTTRFKEEDELELELCLSLGSSFRKTEKLKLNKGDRETNNTTHDEQLVTHAKPGGFDVDLRVVSARDAELGGGACVDPLLAREIHALRRQEAKKKREAKQQQRRGSCRARSGDSPSCGFLSGFGTGERDAKRMRTDGHESVNGEVNGVNLNLSIEQNFGSGPDPSPHPVPPFSPFLYPCVKDKNLVQPVAAGSFRPYRAGQFAGHNAGKGCGSGPNSINGDSEVSNGSAVCSSSGVLDPNSSSLQGGSSCDSGTNSIRPNQTAQSFDRSSSHAVSEIQQRPSSNAENSSAGTTTRQNSINAETGKPPKPQQTQNRHGTSQLFPQMPCVTTTGNGPNGKTINGFLYRYSKSEISIICVCHGNSFSPAEFVRHAGGTEVSHPLRHITVIPSVF